MHILLRKLNAIHQLTDEEQSALLDALSPPRELGRGRDIVSDGSTPGQTTVMISGTACRYKTLPNGKRHILSFQFPGDMTDLYSYVLKRMDHAIGTLSTCTFAHISHEKVQDLRIQFPNLGVAFWRDEWVFRISRSTIVPLPNRRSEIFRGLSDRRSDDRRRAGQHRETTRDQ